MHIILNSALYRISLREEFDRLDYKIENRKAYILNSVYWE